MRSFILRLSNYIGDGKMANLIYYRKEGEEFGSLEENKLTDAEAVYAFKRLRAHYKLQHRLEFFGHRGGGHCGSFTVTLSHQPSVRLLAHEVAHAIQVKKGKLRGARWHTKKHRSIMNRVWKYITLRLDDWKKQVSKNSEREVQSSISKAERQRQTEALKKTPAWKVEHLQALEKKAVSRVKRATTHLNKIRRRIRRYTLAPLHEMPILT